VTLGDATAPGDATTAMGRGLRQAAPREAGQEYTGERVGAVGVRAAVPAVRVFVCAIVRCRSAYVRAVRASHHPSLSAEAAAAVAA